MARKIFLDEMENIPEHDNAALDLLKRRLLGAAVVLLIFAGAVILRLWYLQISHGEDYKNRAYNNRVRVQQVSAPRGHIVDRNGKEIVTNRPSFNVLLVRDSYYDVDDLLKRLSEVLKEDISVLWKRIRDAEGTPLHIPVRLKEDIDWKTLSYLENHNQEFSGIRIEVLPVRVYHYGDLAAHTIGYLGAISKKELAAADRTVYRGGDLIGKMGLEKLREEDLRGKKGSSSSEVNARGFEQRLLKNVDPLPGREIQLTLDVELQQIAEQTMRAGDKAGAVVAMEVKTGRLLTLVSNPTIHLEDFVGGISHKNWNALLENPRHPLINKVVQGTYPPGSTYKMVSALAGLAEGAIDRNTVFFCPGHYYFGNRLYRCWKHSGHGAVDLNRALAESCDVYFYQVGLRVGVDKMAEYAKMLGLGQRTGVELEHEKNGLAPTKNWKRRVHKTKWQEGETLSIAIGQGFNLVTPLQVALMTAAVANGGTLYLPQLIESVKDPDGQVIESFTPQVLGDATMYKRYLKQIRQGLVNVVHGEHGTARGVKIEGITIGGKTGTAQVVKLAQYKHLKEKDIPYKFRDHAWFTCFAPAEDPEIAVAVLVEHGLHGGSGAGPVAKEILKKYFEKRLLAMEQAASPDTTQ